MVGPEILDFAGCSIAQMEFPITFLSNNIFILLILSKNELVE